MKYSIFLMKNYKNTHVLRTAVSYFKKYVVFVFALITWLLTFVFKHNPNLTEVLYSNGLYPIIATVLSSVTNLISISLSDLFYGVLFLYLLSLPIVFFIKRVPKKQLLFFSLKLLALLYFLFYWLWGFNYYRASIYNRMAINKAKVSDTAFENTFKSLLLKLEQVGPVDFNSSKQEIDTEIEWQYESLASNWGIPYPNGKRKPKFMLFSAYNASSGVAGYLGPFFNEIHTNKHLLPIQYPAVLAHEKAHQFGITSEAEANFYAWLVCNQSDNEELIYSSNLFMLHYFFKSCKSDEQKEKYQKLLPEFAATDLNEIREYWKRWRNPTIDKVQSKVYDLYLKSNNISNGISNYGGVVQLICNYEQQK